MVVLDGAVCWFLLLGAAWRCLVLLGCDWWCLVVLTGAWCCLALHGCLMVLGAAWRCLVVLGGAGGASWCMAVQCVWFVLFGAAWAV